MHSITTRERRVHEALERVCTADALIRPQRVAEFLSHAAIRLHQGDVASLYEVAPRFDLCQGFAGTPWDRPARLRARLWAGSFAADEPYPTWEALSTLRLLAIVNGDHIHEEVDMDEARRFLERVLAFNLDTALGQSTEARSRGSETARMVLQFVMEHVPSEAVVADVTQEIQAILAQRPVWTRHVRKTLHIVDAIGADHAPIEPFLQAVTGPTRLSDKFREPEDYEAHLTEDNIVAECRDMGRSLRSIGLACRQHAVLARRAGPHLAECLGLRDKQPLDRHRRLVDTFIQDLPPSESQALLGLAQCLDQGVFDDEGITTLLTQIHERDPDIAHGCLRILGQPLGVGQGSNPTCQSARALSLWAEYRPVHLLRTVLAAMDGDVAMAFEGITYHSREQPAALAGMDLGDEVDPVSRLVVPHLDRLYGAMMRAAAGRLADAHKWVNPAFYGPPVEGHFTSCFEPNTWRVTHHRHLMQTLMALDGTRKPLPAGIAVTDDRGRLLGLHAVTVHRIQDGRVYFYNPNNEGRQDWGDGVTPTVQGNGERPGESSLPTEHFGARLYALHHPAVTPMDDGRVEVASAMAKRTWGRSYIWVG